MNDTKKREVVVALSDIRSTHNVGSILRTCDSAGVGRVILAGFTPLPVDRFGRLRKDIAKVALGAENTVKCEPVSNAVDALSELRAHGYQIVGLEQSPKSIDYKSFAPVDKFALVLGNEVEGLSKEVLSACDVVVEIPMRGKKESLNVSVAFGIALFRILNV